MRLEQLSLSPRTLSALRAAGESVESLLCHPAGRPHAALPPPVLQHALRALHRLAARPSPPPSPLPPVRSGSPVFDANVGLPSRTVIQLSAPSRAGKTLMCVTLAAAVLRHGHHVVWLDSCAGRWQVRAAVARWASPARLTVVPVSSVSDALRELTRLVAQLHPLSPAPNPRLLVFDSPASLLAPILGLKAPTGWSGHTAMQHLAVSINHFITLSAATVLLTNRVVDGASRPALGNIWSAFVDVQLFLQRVETDEHRVEIRTSATSKRAASSTFSVLITDDGICDNDIERTQSTQQSPSLQAP